MLRKAGTPKDIHYEKQVNREVKRIHISGYRNERLKAQTDGSNRLTYTGLEYSSFYISNLFIINREIENYRQDL